MCDLCDSISRRDLLKAAGTAAATLAIAACGRPAANDLPDAYTDHLFDDTANPGPIKVDPKKIVVPEIRKPEQTVYGEIMPRAAWTKVPLKLAKGVNMGAVEKITLHHSGDGKPFIDDSTADVARHLQIVQQAHLQRGMIDIAYHFAIDRAGRAWQLRWLQYEGQHVRPGKNGVRNNAHNIGIVVIGDFNLQTPTAAQRDRIFSLVKLLRVYYTPPGAAAIPFIMHGELVSTDCPGKQLSPLIVEARKKKLV